MSSPPHEETIYDSNISISRANYDYPWQAIDIAGKISSLAEITKDLKKQNTMTI